MLDLKYYAAVALKPSYAVVSLLALSGLARAADLPARIPPAAPFISVPFTWTGPYAGVNAGYAFGINQRRSDRGDQVISFPSNANNPGSGFTTDNRDFSGVGTPINVLFFPTQLNLSQESRAAIMETGANPSQQSFAFDRCGSRSGFTGGGQVGYNYQVTPGAGLVIGLEADAQYADLGRGRCGNSGITVPASLLGPPLFSSTVAIERIDEAGVSNGRSIKTITFINPDTGNRGIDWFGTVRGRLGYAIDRVLFYGTGGFAYGEGPGDRGGIRTGWAAGGGVEYALPSTSWLNLDRAPITGSVIYARDQDGNNYYAPASALRSLNRNSSDDFVVARVGLNYKF
jgi:outer membrane immunogenic protein